MSDKMGEYFESTRDREARQDALLRNAGRLILDPESADKHKEAVAREGVWFKVRYALREMF